MELGGGPSRGNLISGTWTSIGDKEDEFVGDDGSAALEAYPQALPVEDERVAVRVASL